MRLHYNVLWIEDDHDWLDTTKNLFEECIDDLGFRLNPTIFKDGDNIDDLVLQNGFADFDLILVDFNLQNSQTGNTVIEKIRDNAVFTDVLFYSQDVGLVKESLKSMGLEGVYTADRNGIEEKFEIVVKTTLKKIQEVNTMRGLIMAETGILDEEALDIIKRFIDEGTEASTTLTDYIFSFIEETISTKSDDFKKYREERDIVSLLNDNLIFTAYSRARALQKLGKTKGIDELRNFCNDYNKEVIKVRNVFAHAKEIKQDGKTILKGSNDEFDYDSCIKIRRDLLKYSDVFTLVRDQLF